MFIEKDWKFYLEVDFQQDVVADLLVSFIEQYLNDSHLDYVKKIVTNFDSIINIYWTIPEAVKHLPYDKLKKIARNIIMSTDVVEPPISFPL